MIYQTQRDLVNDLSQTSVNMASCSYFAFKISSQAWLFCRSTNLMAPCFVFWVFLLVFFSTLGDFNKRKGGKPSLFWTLIHQKGMRIVLHQLIFKEIMPQQLTYERARETGSKRFQANSNALRGDFQINFLLAGLQIRRLRRTGGLPTSDKAPVSVPV